MAYFDLSKINLAYTNILKVCKLNCSGNTNKRVDIVALTEEHLHQKCQVQDYQNKDRLSMWDTFTTA